MQGKITLYCLFYTLVLFKRQNIICSLGGLLSAVAFCYILENGELENSKNIVHFLAVIFLSRNLSPKKLLSPGRLHQTADGLVCFFLFFFFGLFNQ